MSNWAKMTEAERVEWLQSRVGQRVMYYDIRMLTRFRPNSPRFAPEWKMALIQEWDVTLGRGALLNGEEWLKPLEFADVMDMADYEAMQERAYRPTQGIQHYTRCREDLRAMILACVDVTEDVQRYSYEAHVDEDIVGAFAEAALRSLINLGYTREDLMRAWDAQH